MTELFYTIMPVDYSEHDLSELSKLVSPEKAEKVGAFCHIEDKMLTLIGEVLAKKVISKKSGIEFNKIAFGLGEYLKPYAIELPSIYFNISHSGKFVIVSLADSATGCDVEIKSPFREIDATAEVFMNAKESSLYNSLTGKWRLEYFYKIWSAKESYIKCTGNGIYEGLKSIFIDTENDIKVYHNNAFMREYFLYKYFLDPNYSTYICSKNENIFSAPVKIGFNELKMIGIG